LIARQVEVQSRMLSLNDFFYVSSFAFALALGIIWFARAPHKAT